MGGSLFRIVQLQAGRGGFWGKVGESKPEVGRSKSGDRDSGEGWGNPIQKWAAPRQERWVRMKRWGNPLEGRGYRWPEGACRGRPPYPETSRGPHGLRRVSFRTCDVSTAFAEPRIVSGPTTVPPTTRPAPRAAAGGP